MKKLTLITLSAIVLFGCFTACAKEEAYENFITQQESSLQGAEKENLVSQNYFEKIGLPVPFEYEGGDDNAGFYDAYIYKFVTCPSSIMDEFADYLGMDSMEFNDSYHDKFGRNFWSAIFKNDIMETVNPFSIIIGYDIPNEVVAEAIRKHNELYNNFAIEFNSETYRNFMYTDAEIEALLSRDPATVLEHFATEYVIVKNLHTSLGLYSFNRRLHKRGNNSIND